LVPVVVGLVVSMLLAAGLTTQSWTPQPSGGTSAGPVPREEHRSAWESGQVSATIVNPDTFVYAAIGEPDYLDPAVDYETLGQEIIQNVYETLIWYDRDRADVLVPLLATEVPTLTNGGISSDGLNYTFNLKPGVRFHDHTLMDADDVEYSVERVLRIHDPDGPSWMLEQVMTDYIQYYVGGYLSDFLAYCYGAQWLLDAIGGTDPDYIITELDVQNVSEAAVYKVDSDTVTMRLTHPYPGFLQIAAYTIMSIVSKDYVEAHGGVTNGEHNDWMDSHECGTGPYELVTWDYGVEIQLKEFNQYHGRQPKLANVNIRVEYDLQTRIDMLRAGTADSAYIPVGTESEFSGDPNCSVVKGYSTYSLEFAGFNMQINTTKAAEYGSTVPADFFQDKDVRKAFAHMMNASLLIQTYLKGNGILPNGPIPKGMFGYNASAPVYEYNLTKAVEYLQNTTNPATGHSWWVDGFTVAFLYNAGNLFRETACQYLKAGLEALNGLPGTHGEFHATINSLDWPTYLAAVGSSPSPLPVFFLGWAPDYADPDDYANPFLYSYGLFPIRTHYSNATIDALVLAAAAELDTEKRLQMYHEIVSLAYDDCPYIWLDQLLSFAVLRSWVQGYYFNPMYGGFYYAALSKVETNEVPVAGFTVTPPSGDITTVFSFDASSCSDTEDPVSNLVVRWDWENDGGWDTTWTSLKVASHQYLAPGTYTVRLEVMDTGGLTNSTTAEVVVTEVIPEFPSMIVPVLCLLGVALVLRIRNPGRGKAG